MNAKIFAYFDEDKLYASRAKLNGRRKKGETWFIWCELARLNMLFILKLIIIDIVKIFSGFHKCDESF